MIRQKFLGILMITLLCLLLTQVFAQAPKKVRFDGLYQTKTLYDSPSPYRSFLRFYTDSTVLYVSSIGKARVISKWFKKPFDDRYDCKGKI